MDIADYIRELLGQQGELSIPGLGYFVQMRKSAHYNDQEKVFYPPYHEIEFDPQSIDDDDALANYITERKNISLASSKYFLDKYVSNLKEQASLQDVPFGDFGSIAVDGPNIVFKSKDGSSAQDPAFYGYAPINLNEVPKPAPVRRPEPVVPPPVFNHLQEPKQPVAQPTSYSNSVYHQPPTVREDSDDIPHVFNLKTGSAAEDEYIEEVINNRRSYRPFIIIAIIIVVLGIGAFISAKYRPDLYDKLLFKTHKSDSVPKLPTLNLPQNKITAPSKADWGHNPADSAKRAEEAKAAVQPLPDTIAAGSFIVISNPIETLPKAEDALENLKATGQPQARILDKNVKPGLPYYILLGIFKTDNEANSARIDMNIGKAPSLSYIQLKVQQYNK